MVKFKSRVCKLLKERGQVLNDLQEYVGVNRLTIYRGPKTKSTIAAIAYHLNMSAEELVAGTEVEEIWYKDTGGY